MRLPTGKRPQPKKAETILYQTTHLPETENLYYADNKCMNFDAKICDVFKNLE